MNSDATVPRYVDELAELRQVADQVPAALGLNRAQTLEVARRALLRAQGPRQRSRPEQPAPRSRRRGGSRWTKPLRRHVDGRPLTLAELRAEQAAGQVANG